MKEFKSGDVVRDTRCVDHGGEHFFRNKFGLELVGVVSHVGENEVVGDWLYADGWKEAMISCASCVVRVDGRRRDEILASWTAWRLTQ